MSAPDSEPFSFGRLRQLFALSRSEGYAPIFFGEEDDHQDAAFILWRHDIDIDLGAAVAMARLQTEMGIRATYFLMTQSWFYNLFSVEAEHAIQQLADLGHALGLHCRLPVQRTAAVSVSEVEDRVFSDFVLIDQRYPGLFRKVVSFHNPPIEVINRNFDRFYSTYQERFFGPIKYLSDSNRRWREGPPEGWMRASVVPRLSILLHPVIWGRPGLTMSEGMRDFLDHRIMETKHRLAQDDVEV